MANRQQYDTRTTRRPDCMTEIRMGNSVPAAPGYFKKDTTTTAADKMARILEAETAATQKSAIRQIIKKLILHFCRYTARPIPWHNETTE